MEHALTLYEAVEIHAGGKISWDQCMQIVPLIASEYDMTCGYVAERLAFLGRHAGRPCPISMK